MCCLFIQTTPTVHVTCDCLHTGTEKSAIVERIGCVKDTRARSALFLAKACMISS